MKKINTVILILSAVCLLGSCKINNLDPLEGVYDLPRYDFNTANVGTTQVQDGLKILNVTVSDGSNSLNINFGCDTYTLRQTTYTLASTISESSQYNATLNGASVTYGDLDVVLVSDRYYLTAYMKDSSGNPFIAKYIGPLSFYDPDADSGDDGDDSED